MTQAPPSYDKYEAHGAFHWQAVEAGARRWCPLTAGRYAVALGLLAERLALVGARGLDVGTGDGVMLFLLARAGARVTGVDVSAAGLELARTEIGRRAAQAPWLVAGSGAALPFPDGAFDFAVALEFIEHVPEPERHLAEMRRALRPGGVLVLTTPHRMPDRAVSSPYHMQEFMPEELERLLGAQFRDVQVRGIQPEPFDGWYRSPGRNLLSQARRLGLRLGARWVNPFARVGPARPTTRWKGLIAVGVKP